MKQEELNELLQKWIELSRKGSPADADRFYYDKIFDTVIERFCSKYSNSRSDELLVSILGFSPEPIILTARALKPETHLIISSSLKEEIVEILNDYLDSNFKMVILEKDNFQIIYKTIKEALSDYPTRNITIDITGGKKSMVAAASIFGKDYGCKIVYVDFAEYLKDLRKPVPGTEYLNVVYNPVKDQPENNYLK